MYFDFAKVCDAVPYKIFLKKIESYGECIVLHQRNVSESYGECMVLHQRNVSESLRMYSVTSKERK